MPPSESLHRLLLGRQPILDLRQEVVGYELLFRSDTHDACLPGGGHGATASVVCAAFGELGLATALGRQQAFIIADEGFLDDDALELLPATSVVLELALEQAPTAELLTRCRALRERGYTLALSHYRGLDERSTSLLPLVSYVKIDAQNNDSQAIAHLAGGLNRLPIRLIAQRVETREQMEACRDAGCHLFQGYYFARPDIVAGRKLSASQLGLIRLINLVARDAETADVEAVLKREPGLTVNLLRLVNAVATGIGRRVDSLRQAVAILGRKQLLRWLQLLLMASPESGGAPERNPLLQLAALRGRLMELLAVKTTPDQREFADQAFLVGIMSLMPAALGLPMEEILAQIAVGADMRAALLSRETNLGHLLALVECFDANDSAACDAALTQCPELDRATLTAALTDALAWIHADDE